MGDIVSLDDTRSQNGGIGNPEKCFYCIAAINTPHDYKCVIPQKTVTIKATVVMDIQVPRSWSKEMIEFDRNEGSWCADNWLEDELTELSLSHGCLCNSVVFRVMEEEGNREIRQENFQ